MSRHKLTNVFFFTHFSPQTLAKMENEWAPIVFDVLPYKDTGTYIIKSPDEASQLLDDHIVTMQSFSFSPFKKTFEDSINSWDKRLKMTQVHTYTHTERFKQHHAVSCVVALLCYCRVLVLAERAGRVADMPALLALPGAHLQLR